MNRIKKVFTLIHIILWVLFSLLIALQLSQDVTYWFALTVAVILTTLYVFYSHFLLLTLYLGKNRKQAYFLRLAGIVLTAPVLYILLHPKSLDTFDLLYYFITLFTIVIPFIFLSWLARITENLVLNTIRKEQLEKQAVEAELYYLKSQINPHFLFNTLNNIHTLVYRQAATAPEAVLRLSSLMRYMIYESNAHTVPLSREVAYLQDYIGLQQLRYKKAPVVDLEIAGDAEACFIAPLLFIHFLENAYKHSPARLEPGDIKVKVEIIENTLIFSSQNPVVGKHGTTLDETGPEGSGLDRPGLEGPRPVGPGLDRPGLDRPGLEGPGLERSGGIGLPNIRKRLQLLYPDKHTLEISSTGDRYCVMLKIHDLHLQLHERKDQLLYH